MPIRLTPDERARYEVGYRQGRDIAGAVLANQEEHRLVVEQRDLADRVLNRSATTREELSFVLGRALGVAALSQGNIRSAMRREAMTYLRGMRELPEHRFPAERLPAAVHPQHGAASTPHNLQDAAGDRNPATPEVRTPEASPSDALENEGQALPAVARRSVGEPPISWWRRTREAVRRWFGVGTQESESRVSATRLQPAAEEGARERPSLLSRMPHPVRSYSERRHQRHLESVHTDQPIQPTVPLVIPSAPFQPSAAYGAIMGTGSARTFLLERYMRPFREPPSQPPAAAA